MPQRPEDRIPALDGLRGVAVLLVLLSHASNVNVHLLPFLDLRGLGRAGVFLFFVLSAFLLTGQLLALPPLELRRPATWARYLVRRLLRVYPAYLFWLLAYLALRDQLRMEGLRDWDLSVVGEHLLLTRGDYHLWTIPVELRWYLALPLVVIAVALLRGRLLPSLLLLTLASVALRLLAPPDYGVELAPFAPIFLAGSAAAILHRHWRNLSAERRARLARPADLAALVALGLLCLHAPVVWSLVAGEEVDHRHFHLAFDRLALLWSAFLLALLWGGGTLRRPFETRALRFVGAVSYSTYLAHKAVLVAVEPSGRRWPTLLTWSIFVAASLLLGWLSHRLLERPFARLWARPVAERREEG